MTSGRRGERRGRPVDGTRPRAGTGAGTGTEAGSGSGGGTAARGEEFADALAVANERRDLAARYGDAFTLAEPPPQQPPPPAGAPEAPQARAGEPDDGRERGDAARRAAGDPLDVALGLDARSGGRRPPAGVPDDPRGLTWDAARHVAARSGRRLPAVVLPAAAAQGHVLAAPLEALVDLPPFDTSAMDGYAVAGPGPWRLDSAGRGVLAGHAAPPALPDGHAVRIATGARVPPGATGVLRSEHAELRDDGTLLATAAPRGGAGHAHGPAPDDRRPADRPGRGTAPRPDSRTARDPRPDTDARTARDPRAAADTRDTRAAPDVRTGQDIRPRGQECRAGAELLPAGERVTPAVLGLAAAAGHDELRVVRRPRVEVLVLGAELLHRGLPREGRIRDALGPMLEPWLRACGAEPFVTRRLGDDAELLYEAIATSTADVVVTTGGTAAGPVDHVHGTLRRLKADLLVDGVAVRPGHPMLLAVLPTGAHVVGLPGNPLAAVSGLLTLAEPLVRVLGGAPVPEPPEAVLTADAKGHPADTRLVPVALEHPAATAPRSPYAARGDAPHRPHRPGGGSPPPYPSARPLHFTGPAMLRGLAVADALAVVPPRGASAGTAVRILRLPWTTPAGPA